MLQVIDEGNERVPAVSGDHDVARRVEDGDAVGGRVGLDIPAVGLRLEPCTQFVEIKDAAIEPRPHLYHGARKVAIGPQQRGDYRLHPRRAALGRRADEDVTWAVVVGGPPGAVNDGRSIDSLLRPHLGLVFLFVLLRYHPSNRAGAREARRLWHLSQVLRTNFRERIYCSALG